MGKEINSTREKDYNQPPKQFFDNSGFQPNWITKEANEQLPCFADSVGGYMENNKLTNSKIRSIYGEIKRIQMNGFDNQKSSFYLLKPKVAYAFGRDKTCRGLELFKIIFDKASSFVTDSKTFQNFCNLMEAILAYHKAHGGE